MQAKGILAMLLFLLAVQGRQGKEVPNQMTVTYELMCKAAYCWRVTMFDTGDIQRVKKFLSARGYSAVRNADDRRRLEEAFRALRAAQDTRANIPARATHLHNAAYQIIDLCACGRFSECADLRCMEEVQVGRYFAVLTQLAAKGDVLMAAKH